MQKPELSFNDILTILSPNGRQELAELIRQAKAEHGPKWLSEIKAEFPNFSFVIDLIANHDADYAFDHFKNEYETPGLSLFRPQLIAFHGFLRAEIDRPR